MNIYTAPGLESLWWRFTSSWLHLTPVPTVLLSLAMNRESVLLQSEIYSIRSFFTRKQLLFFTHSDANKLLWYYLRCNYHHPNNSAHKEPLNFKALYKQSDSASHNPALSILLMLSAYKSMGEITCYTGSGLQDLEVLMTFFCNQYGLDSSEHCQ